MTNVVFGVFAFLSVWLGEDVSVAEGEGKGKGGER